MSIFFNLGKAFGTINHGVLFFNGYLGIGRLYNPSVNASYLNRKNWETIYRHS